jgi:Spy/CpxP family protein refolding chaperone
MKARIMCFAAALCFFFTMPAWPQTQTPPTPTKPVVDTDSIVSNIQSQLKLTVAQAKKITPIIDEENQKLSKILTPDQMNQWLNALNQIHLKHKKSKHGTASGSKT